jgi:hypothetical protein
MAQLRGDADDLTRLDVGAVRGELRQHLEPVVGHGRRS